MLEGRVPRPERIVGVEIQQLIVRLHRCQRHPVKREEKHNHDDCERQIDIDETGRRAGEIAHAVGMVLRGGSSHSCHPAAICAAAIQTTTP